MPVRADVAREHFRRGGRLDMAALAAELGVGRATLYRETGDRDRLRSDIMIAEFDAIAAHIHRHFNGQGARRIEDAAAVYMEIISPGPAIRAFLSHEGADGLRPLQAQ